MTVLHGRTLTGFVAMLLFAGCQDDPGRPRPITAREFVHWETPHVSPLALTPGGTRLLAVNTPDNRLEVFNVTSGAPVPVASIAVGLDPVSVRAPSDAEAWVVNHVSDSVSVVDLAAGCVIRTLQTADEPTDVVFTRGRAFVTCSQANEVWVFDLSDLDAEPRVIPIVGEDPRALAVSADGARVFAAVFESGNNTTVIGQERVSHPNSPYAGRNPPPNAPDGFRPPLRNALPLPPRTALILRRDERTARWVDDNGVTWNDAFAPWRLADHDVAVIDAADLSVTYIRGLMNLNLHLTVRADGQVVVVGTDAINHVRFEPNLTGRFVQSVVALVDPARPEDARVLDLNPHLADANAAGLPRVAQALRDQSIADPRGVVWRSDNSVGYVAGMGSDNVAILAADGRRLGQFEVGAGPTGLALDESRDRLYVLNKFDATIMAIDTQTGREAGRAAMYDPTPAVIRAGRPLLYDARRTSGLGVTACASCHVDARMDQLAWDLGDPGGEMKPFDQECRQVRGVIGGSCEDFHPLKGPMVTQTLQGIIGNEPFHWRADRDDLDEFNPAFVSLLGGDEERSAQEMRDFTDFLATIRFPPNPFRNADDTLKPWLVDGNPVVGEIHFRAFNHDQSIMNCVECHNLPDGTNRALTPRRSLDGIQSLKVPQLRNFHEKRGFRKEGLATLGFGYAHDGRFEDLVEFLHFRVFAFPPGEDGDQQRRDIQAFLMSFSQDTHPAVGMQVTLDRPPGAADEAGRRLALMRSLADQRKVGLVARGRVQGQVRGYAYRVGGRWQADRAGEMVTWDALLNRSAPGSELTLTVVPLGSETRIGIDRDLDGVFDGDAAERAARRSGPARMLEALGLPAP